MSSFAKPGRLAYVDVFFRSLTAPLRGWSPMARLLAAIVAIACCMARVLYIVAHSESVFVAGDARFYLGIATGDYSQVMQPFASRQLGALVVTALMHTLHWTVERGFIAEGGVSLIVLFAIVYYLAIRTAAPRWMLFAIAVVPFWGLLFEDLVLPDLWYSALLAIMLLMLAREHMLAAALMMFPLMLSRESTSLTLVCFLISAWGWLRWRDRIVAIASSIAGSLIVSHLALRAQPNMEHLPQFMYMLAKVPWNFMNNILGIVPWSNVNSEFCAVPIWSLQLRVGPVDAIGVCGFSHTLWIPMAQAILTDFGLLPVLVFWLWWRYRRVAERNVLLRFTLIYGSISLVLAPVLGTWFVRLIGYAWPIFFVALPLLFDRLPKPPEGSRATASIGFFAAHLTLIYVSWFWPPRIGLELVLWVLGFLLARHGFSDERETCGHHQDDRTAHLG